MSHRSLPNSVVSPDALDATHWHTVEADKAVRSLESDRANGLTSQQVAERLQRYGTNELVETGG
ncbi:MAG: hypothetical protein HC852_15520, partial [Acaryochloridaceae cyanobacterium RU_4_10]|nr:hypothetical protein [Acaryochloridaceae cyanobacterium RU_4_10]